MYNLYALLIQCIAISPCRAYRSLFISSFDGINGPYFQSLIKDSVVDTGLRQRLCFVPTAAYAPSKDSAKPPGERRRRNRYAAKQNAKAISQSIFSCWQPNEVLEPFLLELDAPDISASVIEKSITSSTVLCIGGGNTFYLQKCIIDCGFWSVVESRLASDSLLFIGSSAGAIVASPTISTAYWKGWDDPNALLLKADELCFSWNEDNLKGRALINSALFMHYQPQSHDSLIAEKRTTLTCPLVCLRDDMGLAVFGREVAAAGRGTNGAQNILFTRSGETGRFR